MSKPPPDEPPRGGSDRASYIEWFVAWLIVIAAGAMLVSALAKLLQG